jgi:hypothetical protein
MQALCGRWCGEHEGTYDVSGGWRATIGVSTRSGGGGVVVSDGFATYVSVVAADNLCTEWLSVPTLVFDDAALHEVPQCGAVSMCDGSDCCSSGVSGSASGASNDELRKLRASGTYAVADNISRAYYCVAVFPLAVAVVTPTMLAAEVPVLVWRQVGELKVISLFNCTTGAAVGITPVRVAPATPLQDTAAFGVSVALTSTRPWLSLVGGGSGCAAAASNPSFTAVQTAVREQGFLTADNTTPAFFVCVTSPDGSLTFTTASPSLTVDGVGLRPHVAIWGVLQVYNMHSAVVLPFPNRTYFTFVAQSSSSSSPPLPPSSGTAPSTLLSSTASGSVSVTVIRVSAAALAGGGTDVPVLLGNAADLNGTFVTSEMTGIYRLLTFGTWVASSRSGGERLEAVVRYGFAASLVVLRPPVITYASYTTPLTISLPLVSTEVPSGLPQSSSLQGKMGKTFPITFYPARVPAGARVCAASYVPSNLYSQVPGRDRTDDAYAAYRPYYYYDNDIGDDGSNNSRRGWGKSVYRTSSGSGGRGGLRGMFLKETTAAAWLTSQEKRHNICAASSDAVERDLAYVTEDGGEVCFDTAGLKSGPGVLYVVCAGTPAGYAEATTSLLTLTSDVTVNPSAFLLNATTLVHVPQLPNVSFVLVPRSLSLSSGAGLLSTSSSSPAAASACDVLTTAGVGNSGAAVYRWPHFTTNASGYGVVSLSTSQDAEAVFASSAAVTAGAYTLCYWWPNVTATAEHGRTASTLAEKLNRFSTRRRAASAAYLTALVTAETPIESAAAATGGGAWVLASDTITVYAPLRYHLSSLVLVAPLVSTVVLLQGLTTAHLLPGFYTSATCAARVPGDVLSWSAVRSQDAYVALASPFASATSGTGHVDDDGNAASTLIAVNATAALPDAVFLCARSPENDKRVAVAASGLRVVKQPFHIPYSSSASGTTLPTCREFNVYFQNSTGVRSGSYMRNVGGTEMRVSAWATSGLADLLGAMRDLRHHGSGGNSAGASASSAFATAASAAAAADSTTTSTTVRITLTSGPCCVHEATASLTSPLTSTTTLKDNGSISSSGNTSGAMLRYTADGVWVGAGTLGYLVNDTTLREVAAAQHAAASAGAITTTATAEATGSSSGDAAGGVRLPFSLCLTAVIAVAGAPSSDALQCAMVGQVWIGTANSSCTTSGSSGSHISTPADARAGLQVRPFAEPRHVLFTAADINGVNVTSENNHRAAVSSGVLPLVTSLSATRANVFRTIALPTGYSPAAWRTIIAGSVLCGLYVILTPLITVVTCGVLRYRYNRRVKKLWEGYGGPRLQQQQQPQQPLGLADSPERCSSVSPSCMVGVDEPVDEPVDLSVGWGGPTPASTPAKTKSHHRRGGNRARKAKGKRDDVGDRRRSSSIAPHPESGWWSSEALPPAPQQAEGESGAWLVAASGDGGDTAGASSDAVLTAVQIKDIEQWLLGPSRGDAHSIDLSLPEPVDRITGPSATATAAEATLDAPLSRAEKTEKDAAKEKASMLSTEGSAALQTLYDVVVGESNARCVLVRAEEAAIIAVLESEQRDWRTMVRGEGVRLKSLLMQDPYWAPRLTELELVNRQAMAAAEQRARGATSTAATATNTIRGMEKEETDSDLMTALSDSVRLYPLPRASPKFIEPVNDPANAWHGAGEELVGGIFSDRSAADTVLCDDDGDNGNEGVPPLAQSSRPPALTSARPPVHRRLDVAAAMPVERQGEDSLLTRSAAALAAQQSGQRPAIGAVEPTPHHHKTAAGATVVRRGGRKGKGRRRR